MYEASREIRERILFAVKPGRAYAPSQIATNMKVPVESIRHHLAQLVAEGKLTRITPAPGTRTPTFCVPGSESELSKQTPADDPALIAQPRVKDVFTGCISGYESEIARRTALCMSIRRGM